jgi:hypothetical protein
VSVVKYKNTILDTLLESQGEERKREKRRKKEANIQVAVGYT